MELYESFTQEGAFVLCRLKVLTIFMFAGSAIGLGTCS